MAKETVTITFSALPSVEKYIEKIAKDLGQSRSWVIRRAIFLLKEQYGGRF